MTFGLTQSVALTLLGIAACMVVATVAVWLAGRLFPEHDLADLKLRTRTWWVLVAVMLLAAATGRTASLIFLALVSYLALKEYLSLIATRRCDRVALMWVYAAIPLQTWLAASGQAHIIPVFVPLYGLLGLSTYMVLALPPQGFIQAAGTFNLGMLLTVFAPGFVSCVLMLPDSINPAGGATGLVVYLILLVQFNDVAQYLSGKALGRTRILPTASPNKTWEGFLLGLIATIVLAWLLAPVITPFESAQAMVVGLLIGAGGFVGDATVSVIKRDLRVKDTGALLPGHGGVLDRVDSLIVAAPLFYCFVNQLYL